MTTVNSKGKELMNGKPRNLTMDALKLFAILLVIWGHCVQYLVSSEYYTEPVYRIIYSFHMPLFMTISGFFGANLIKKDFKEVILSKSRQLLVPIVAFGLLLCFLIGFRFACFGALWFLNSLFICSLGYYLIVRTKRFCPVLFVLSLILVVLFPMPYEVSKMWPFFLLGALLSYNYEWLKDNAGKIAITVLPVFIVMLFFWDETFFLPVENLQSEKAADYGIWYPLMLQGYRYLIGFCGVMFFIAGFHFLAPKLPRSNYGDKLLEWGKFTLGVYIVQKVVLEMGIKHFLNFDNFGFAAFNFVIVPLLSIVILAFCIAIVKTIRRSRYMSFVILGEKLAR